MRSGGSIRFEFYSFTAMLFYFHGLELFWMVGMPILLAALIYFLFYKALQYFENKNKK